MKKNQDSASVDLALFVLRLALGVIFLAHALQKFGFFGGAGMAGVVGMMEGLSLDPPRIWAWILALSELASGVFMLLGAFVRIAAVLIAVIMTTAMIKVHIPNGFFASDGGVELPLILLAAAIAVFLSGSGRFALYRKF